MQITSRKVLKHILQYELVLGFFFFFLVLSYELYDILNKLLNLRRSLLVSQNGLNDSTHVTELLLRMKEYNGVNLVWAVLRYRTLIK